MGSQKQHNSRPPMAGIAIMLAILAGLLADRSMANNDNIYSDIMRLDGMVTKIHQNYVEEMDSKDLVDKAIDGMLGILDPHTAYFEPKQYDDLRIHTEGKFGGLGIQISIRDKELTVMTPISGTPASRAGILSGDQIIEIEGKSTRGIKLDAAVGKLRGEPGTEVKILIRRRGEDKPLPFTLTREVIRITSIPYYGIFNTDIGYVRISQFSQQTSNELDSALRVVLKKGAKSLVLDLRSNPGGLLPQAIEVASKFLPQKALVVFTRGRAPGQNNDYPVTSTSLVPADMPVVVLVNGASASASEIVAGAIQDWDRGVILGDTTFGKGSVQTILQLDKTHHLKMTTAFYYTPSGRCINKPENAIRGVDKESLDEDGEESADTSDTDKALDARHLTAKQKSAIDTAIYRTKAGRIVYGSGGIIPDTVVNMGKFDEVVASLFRQDLYFKFANLEYPRLQKRKIKIDAKYVMDDVSFGNFKTFLDSLKFSYKTNATVSLDELKKRLGLSDTVDSAAIKAVEEEGLTPADLATCKSAVTQISSLLKKRQDEEFSRKSKEIRKYVQNAILVHQLGQDNEVIFRNALADDAQFKAATALLANKNSLNHFLASPPKK